MCKGIFSIGFFLLASGMCLAQANDSIQLAADQPSTGSVGTNTAVDTKLVTTPPVPEGEQQQFQQAIKDIHFDFDRSELRPEDREILAKNAEWLKAHPDVLVVLEGDADERGDIVYNLVLSGQRAMVTRDTLVEMGVSAERIAFATGWGELYPVCSSSDESCWSQNRRTHIATWPPEEEATRVASR